MPQADFDTNSWRELNEKKSGVKVLAKITGNPIDTEIGFFKYSKSDTAGPIAANEFIAHRLARKLDLPIPDLYFKEFSGLKGSLSIKAPGAANVWRDFPHKDNVEGRLVDFDMLGSLIIFDIYIQNIDRNPENLVYSRTGTRRNYDFYLIDHGHSLYGPTNKSGNHKEFNPSRNVQIPELVALFDKEFAFFKPHIEKIQNLDDQFLSDLVDRVEKDYLTDEQNSYIKTLLLERKKILYNEFKVFIEGRK